MTSCTATLTTADVEPCAPESMHRHTDLCTEIGGQWHRITLYTLTCVYGDSDHVEHLDGTDAVWTDDTPGATAHTDPPVTNAEIDAACEALQRDHALNLTVGGVRAALEAAARVRLAGDA